MKSMEELIINLIKEISPYVEIALDTQLLEEEILDSVSILILVTEIEEKYQIEIPMEEVNPNNFASVRSIIELLISLGIN